MTMPVGERHVAFVCTSDHATLGNAERTGEFTMSWVPADGVVLASLTAAPRQPDGSKPALAAVPTRPATVVGGVVLRDAPLCVECRLDRVSDGFGRWAVVVGEIVHAEASSSALLTQDEDAHDVLAREPVLAYLDPGHVATIARADHFPFHEGFSR
jgi:flavin reductase (DIM6/NTAB) family NADH-FMN oxidoreductase RutF